jgi:hypothetical protein
MVIGILFQIMKQFELKKLTEKQVEKEEEEGSVSITGGRTV